MNYFLLSWLSTQITKFESFTRQVNGWGFKRITQGPDLNSYYHELFLQGMPHLIQWMKRVSPSRHGRRKIRADPKDEPNFYDISSAYPIPDYYSGDADASRGGVSVPPIPSADPRQITPALETYSDQGRARSYSDTGENKDPRYLNKPVLQYDYTFGRTRSEFYNTSAGLNGDHQGSDSNKVLRELRVEDIWTNTCIGNHQQPHQAKGIVSDYSSDMYDCEPSAVSLANSTGTEPVATKSHWQCFYDAMADDVSNCSDHGENQSGITDLEDPDSLLRDITPVPIEYPTIVRNPSKDISAGYYPGGIHDSCEDHHRQNADSHFSLDTCWG